MDRSEKIVSRRVFERMFFSPPTFETVSAVPPHLNISANREIKTAILGHRQMTLAARKKLPHATPSWVADRAVFFVTINVLERGKNTLCDDPVATALFESMKFRQQRGDWHIYLLLLMPDHLHGLFAFPRDRSMKRMISSWKEYTAKAISIRWQSDFFDHRLRDHESFAAKEDYIRMNPVRKGYVADPNEWRYVYRVSE